MDFLASCIKKHKQIQLNHFSAQYSLLNLTELRYSVENRRIFKTSPNLEYTGVQKQQNKHTELQHEKGKTRINCSSSLCSQTTKTSIGHLEKPTASETNFQAT